MEVIHHQVFVQKYIQIDIHPITKPCSIKYLTLNKTLWTRLKFWKSFERWWDDKKVNQSSLLRFYSLLLSWHLTFVLWFPGVLKVCNIYFQSCMWSKWREYNCCGFWQISFMSMCWRRKPPIYLSLSKI